MKIQNTNLPKRDHSFHKKFVSSQTPKFIFGYNNLAESIIENFPITGIIDEFTQKKKYGDTKVYKLSEVPKNALVISVIIGRPLLAESKLKKYNLKYINYFAFSKISSKKLMPARHWIKFKKDFYINKDKYKRIYKLLSDEISRSQFTKIINFRLSSNIKYMKGFKENQKNQYFETFLKLGNYETFVDIGCFDGYTSEMFIKKTKKKYNEIHIFEPEKNNMKVCKKNLKKYKNIIYHGLGLSNKSQKLFFSNQGSRSRVIKTGNNSINVKKLDDLNLSSCSFLKMDIEGGEINALKGMKKTIKKYRPKIAISIYHKYDDFWKIPEIILQINKSYKLFVRHYTEGVDETVMFFIPT